MVSAASGQLTPASPWESGNQPTSPRTTGELSRAVRRVSSLPYALFSDGRLAWELEVKTSLPLVTRRTGVMTRKSIMTRNKTLTRTRVTSWWWNFLLWHNAVNSHESRWINARVHFSGPNYSTPLLGLLLLKHTLLLALFVDFQWKTLFRN